MPDSNFLHGLYIEMTAAVETGNEDRAEALTKTILAVEVGKTRQRRICNAFGQPKESDTQ